jgi:signal transduction histidine kinase
MRLTSRFLRDYQFDVATAWRLERVLGIGRVFLALTALVTMYLHPMEPSRFATVTHSVLAAYTGYCALVLVWLMAAEQRRPLRGVILHAADIGWASVLTFLDDGPVSPFFSFFLFAVGASAFRWGFREMVATSLTTIGIMLLQIAVSVWGPWHSWLSEADPEIDRVFLRIAYLIVTGFLFGYLAEQDKQSRAELAAIGDLPRQTSIDQGLRGLVTTMAQGLLRTFDANSVAIAISEPGASATLWRLVRQAGEIAPGAADRLELTDEQRALWLFNAPARAWHANVSPTGASTTFWIAERGRWPLRKLQAAMPFAVTSSPGPGTLTAVDLHMASEGTGRVYVFNSKPLDNVERAVHFLEAIAEHLTPALTNVFLHRRLQAQESAAERARVARELHDGAIQALYGIEMKLEALRRRPTLAPGDQEEVTRVRDLVHGEAISIRELMHSLRPIELDANETLADVLVAIVERFRRDTGISARFVPEGNPGSLRPAAALELIRIVQESLVNIRKHSHATNVLVRLVQEGSTHRLLIEDDGCGFEFEGRLSAPELEARRAGPAIIRERARILGASLAVESSPGAGARIELTLAGNGRL